MKNVRFLIAALLVPIIFFIVRPVLADNITFTSTPPFSVASGATYTYKITVNDAANSPVSFSFPNLPNWLAFNPATTTLSGKAVNAGRFPVFITATDSLGSSAHQNYFLTVIGTSLSPTLTPSLTPTPSTSVPLGTTTPTPSVTAMPTPTATTSPSPTTTAKIQLSSLSPADGSTTTETSPKVSATVTTPFALDKKNTQVFFDNQDVTSKTSLSTKTNPDGTFQNIVTLQTSSLSDGTHNVNFVITTPDGISVPESWSFKVSSAKPAVTTSLADTARKILSSQLLGFGVLFLLLLLIIITIIRLIRHGSKLNRENGSNTPQQT